MKKMKDFKRILTWLLVGLFSSLLAQLIIEGLQRFGFTDTLPYFSFFLVGTVILFIFYALFSALLRSAVLGGSALVTTAIIIGSVNRVKILYRADPLFPSDFIIAKEVPFLVEMVGWFYFIVIISTIGLGISISFYFYQKTLKPNKREVSRKIDRTTRGASILVSVLALFYLSQFQQPGHPLRNYYFAQADWTFEQQLTDYHNNGFIAGFLTNIQGDPMVEPSDYSRERVRAIVEKYRQLADKINSEKEEITLDTNILFVMNESFSDPFNLEGIASHRDPLRHFRALEKESFHGQVVSPTFGGGTNANEFQALTGISLEPLNPQIKSPYVQLDKNMDTYPTIVHKLNALNYQTTAIHPYNQNFFKRDEVYVKMGFAHFLHDKNMTNTEKVSEDHFFISDASAYKEVLKVLNASPETDFIHVVTMQNHTPYAEQYETVEYRVFGSGNDNEAAGYFQDLEHSDQALQDLMDEINQHPEPILLVFWGDHLPGFYRGEVREKNDEWTLRQTPLLVYSNTKDIKGEAGTTSPIYFSNWIYDWLDIKLSAYDALLLALEEVLPMMDDGMYLENDVQLTSRKELSPEALEVLEEYTLILYDITTGQQYVHSYQFFE